ncbi:hypothetical protein DICPUDRAFT_158015 [Dictyostelium purpureum]|uniref:Uncharacterized protein n=1 Tax=Dictyostelium purpureum TaxID=5786 RepID=F1A0L4_DICPU|nr:uncharacterized protein DICPUDRAFT_158015 [Dictyostelium purpureum]EGC30256.1 hypothetical protein DICPUDRAFT_158015 [Dictyostelium purpureum]|eukprot:XP_003293208.1 hypothetical protein DICPUDRAFT_158015 [Dictyostelium purpureum]
MISDLTFRQYKSNKYQLSPSPAPQTPSVTINPDSYQRKKITISTLNFSKPSGGLII